MQPNQSCAGVLARVRQRWVHLLLAGLLLASGLALAPRPAAAQGTLTCVNKTTDNGLGSNTVLGVYTDGSTVYAATARGLSISTDGGAAFINKTTDNGLSDNWLKSVYASGSTVYAATFGGGVSISTNGGASFINYTTDNGLGTNDTLGVYASGSTVYAATFGGGLSISTNGGDNFINKTTTNGLGDKTVYGVYGSGSTVYAATHGGLSISTDGGDNFTNYTTANGLGNNTVRGVYAEGSTVYAATFSGLSICTLATPAAPEIDVQGNGVSIASGDSTPATADDTDFGTVTVGSAVTHTFTISNPGTADLTGVEVFLTGSACAAGANVCAASAAFHLVSLPAFTIAAGASSTFTVAFAPSAVGVVEETISITSNDSDENPYEFAVNGNGVAPTTITIVLDAVPNLPTNLGFGGSFGPFILDDPAVDDSDAYTNTKSFSVAPGVYTVRRNNPAGWFTTAIVCTPDGKAAINLPQRNAALSMASGDSVICTFTVERAVVITARAFNDLVRRTTNLGKRNAGDPWLNGQSMTLSTSPTQTLGSGVTAPIGGASQVGFANLRAGSYTVCTTFPIGWTLTTPTAIDPAYGQPCKPITLVPGQNVLLLFGAYGPTVVASTAFTTADKRITDEDTIVNRPYDPAEDETATDEDGLPRLFLLLVMQ